jgi:hypothetical protein
MAVFARIKYGPKLAMKGLIVFADLTQTAWTLEAEIKSKSGKDLVGLHEEVGKNIPLDLPKRLRMSMQYQEVMKHMSDVSSTVDVVDSLGR